MAIRREQALRSGSLEVWFKLPITCLRSLVTPGFFEIQKSMMCISSAQDAMLCMYWGDCPFDSVLHDDQGSWMTIKHLRF